MKIGISLFVLAMGLIGLVGLSTYSTVVLADTDGRLGEDVKIWDDGEIYLAVLARHFERSMDDVRGLGRKFNEPEDLAMVLFLASHSGKSPDFIVILRQEGASWWEIGEGFGVDPDAWFLRNSETTPPPFDLIHESWQDATLTGDRLALSDTDCRCLVAARVLHDYFVVSAGTAMEWRSTGKDLQELTAAEYRARHVQGRGNGQGSDRASLLMESSLRDPGTSPRWD